MTGSLERRAGGEWGLTPDGINGDRDALGRITKKTEWIVASDEPEAGVRPLDARAYDYGYNPEGRPWLESVAVDGTVVSSYGYDANGNRTSAELNWSQLGYNEDFDASLTPADTEYNSADQLLRYGTKQYSWNNFGQLQSMTDTDPNGDGDTSDSESTFYDYDLYGNLLRVDLPDGRAIEYDVDGAGRRVGRRELDAQGNEISFRGWIYRDLLRPIAEVDAAGNVVARYVYDDGGGARQNSIGQIATRLGADQDTSVPFSGDNVPDVIEHLGASGAVAARFVLIKDQVGSVRGVADATSGDFVQRLAYDEFGRVVRDSFPLLQPFGYAGGLMDVETGLVRFGARDYSPEVARWVGADPVRFAGLDYNLWAYSFNNPFLGADVAGLMVYACQEWNDDLWFWVYGFSHAYLRTDKGGFGLYPANDGLRTETAPDGGGLAMCVPVPDVDEDCVDSYRGFVGGGYHLFNNCGTFVRDVLNACSRTGTSYPIGGPYGTSWPWD